MMGIPMSNTEQPTDLTQTPEPADKPVDPVDLAHPGPALDTEQPKAE